MTEERFPGEGPDGTYGDPAMPADPGHEPVDGVEPDIDEAVHHIANRYGTVGLDQLITTAQRALAEAQRAQQELQALGD